MRGILVKSMANILGVKKEFKLWQAVVFYLGALTVLVGILMISQG